MQTWRSLACAWRSLTRDETHVCHGVRVYIPSTCSLTHGLRTVDWMVCLEADGRASSTRAVADLLCLMLVVEPTFASSQQSIECGSTAGQSGRVVATRWPVSGGAWCVPESSRTSGQSAGEGDLRDRWSAADTCLVLLRSVGSPRACIEQRLVWDSRLAVKDDWASSDFLLSRLVEFSFVLGRGLLF